ncbi:hypothetical protein RHMOL_Rhmol06G0081400 [Rhododendron molle]|uniref:Uncharacterized protein n=1 Tax=Rhododendron molle TaxID=49168 RepID=A0ACC0NAA3_RHOML|nr:hypothetical protein RHMOL_Rhmol06G0081400 [Rhododendron molle]
MAVQSPVSTSLADFPPLGFPNSKALSVGAAEGFSTDASHRSPWVFDFPNRNVAFELLDEDLRKIYSHLQFRSSDNPVSRQIKTLTAENLVLPHQAEANLSQMLIDGKSPKLSSPWKNLLVNEGNTGVVWTFSSFLPLR